MSKPLISLVPLLALVITANRLVAVDAPAGLLCDLIPAGASVGVSATPAFSWQVQPAEAASVQGAYQLQVASGADLNGEVWDSGST